MTTYATYRDWDKSPQELFDTLRSGNYKQGHGGLVVREYDDETDEQHVIAHCCIGVYEDICTDHWSAVDMDGGSLEDILPEWDHDLALHDEQLHWLRTKVRMQRKEGWQERTFESLLIMANDSGKTTLPFERPIKILEGFLDGKREWSLSELRGIGVPV